ncbi:hypothetical protein niasHS_013678 [Heterodera schachtii]|uniref:Uncharacterized protein n=1 Tax=Heterodera schachtii TaxID=97005 RepID=A0ABD2IA28_HETSC
MHYYQLGFHILLLSVIGLLYQAHGHENDEDQTGYENLTEQDMNEMCMDPGLIAGIMKARAETGQAQSNAQGQQANNSHPTSPPRPPATGPTVTQSAPSRPTVTAPSRPTVTAPSRPTVTESAPSRPTVTQQQNEDDDDDDDFQENLQRAFRESEQDFQSKNNAIYEENLRRTLAESAQALNNDDDVYEENLRRALADSAQAIQSNNDHDFQNIIEASKRESALEEEKQFELARTLSMGHSRNNYDNGVGSDNEDIETQQALIRSFSVQSNQRRNNRVSNPQPSNDREFNAEQYYGEASSSGNANVTKPKKKKKKDGNKKTEAEMPLLSSLSSSSSSSTRRLTRSRTTTKVKEEPSTSAGSLRRSKTKKETRKEKEESSSAGSPRRSKTKKDDTTKEKGKNPLQKFTKSLSSMFSRQITCFQDVFIPLKYNTGVTDLLRIIYVSVDAALRRLHFDAWLALYCSELNRVLTQLDKAPPDQQQRSMELIRQNDGPP